MIIQSHTHSPYETVNAGDMMRWRIYGWGGGSKKQKSHLNDRVKAQKPLEMFYAHKIEIFNIEKT